MDERIHNLTDHNDLLVATNNINVVNTLIGCEKIKILVATGTVRDDGAITGETAVQFVSQFMIDYALIGVSAIDANGSLLDFDAHEVQVAQAIIRNSRKVIVVADAVKFQRRAPIRIATINDLNCFVTDIKPPATFIKRCNEAEVEVIVTDHKKQGFTKKDSQKIKNN